MRLLIYFKLSGAPRQFLKERNWQDQMTKEIKQRLANKVDSPAGRSFVFMSRYSVCQRDDYSKRKVHLPDGVVYLVPESVSFYTLSSYSFFI